MPGCAPRAPRSARIGEGVVLYADTPPDDRSWRYAVIGMSAGDVGEQEAVFAEVFASG
ncbi:hypothetical protein Slala03_47330 [Streptomyces lavendulae subsp. lavendulae]|uniref:hypothetical protein n=1 Tax=Streptomyces lavendulae TaxID=1914 RepID=UPI0024A1A8B4|nr:hypothetical protein [Streptomyces lavendulae]GLV85044.1 hypothetical protein Slala03_47330 [Streptomyces lavendulae subsp. lavendulae]